MFLKPIILGDTTNLDKATWLKWRDHGPEGNIEYTIGGSDVSVICNENPWKTPVELYHQKKNRKPKYRVEHNKQAKQIGHIFEPYICDLFVTEISKKHKVQVVNDMNLYRCGEQIINDDGGIELKYPYALANIDRICIIDGKKGVLEIKTTSPHNYEAIQQWKKGIVPYYYLLQIAYYMVVMDLPYTYIICAWGYTKSDFAYIRVERDPYLETLIMESCDHFIWMLQYDVEPCPDLCNSTLLYDYYCRLYGPPAKRQITTIPKNYSRIVSTLVDLEDTISGLKKQVAEYEESKVKCILEMMDFFKENERGSICIDGREITVVCEQPKRKAKINWAFVKKNYPQIFNKCNDFTPAAFKEQTVVEGVKLDRLAIKYEKAGSLTLADRYMKQAEELRNIYESALYDEDDGNDGKRNIKIIIKELKNE